MLTLLSFFLSYSKAQYPQVRAEEVRRFPAAEAHQSVAVDEKFFYAIDGHSIGKYDKATGKRVAGWDGGEDGPIHHLNSGVVIKGKMYCANSNYPGVPMASSVEIFDVKTMRHIGTHSLGIFVGSATWIDFHNGSWYMGFAHYKGKNNDEPTRDPRWTSLIRFDKDWHQVEAWAFPPEVVERFGNYSCSGGVFGRDGLLYATGHDNPECYLLRIPSAGPYLELVQTVPIPNQGQGIALDPTDNSMLYGIERKGQQVVVSRFFYGK